MILKAKPFFFALLLACTSAFAQLPTPGAQGSINDPRYCGEPARTSAGAIKRDRAVLRAFRKVFPCPATLQPGACPGWQLNHQLPLAAGGCDAVANLWWQPVATKVCRKEVPWNTDCWELKYHATPRRAVVLK